MTEAVTMGSTVVNTGKLSMLHYADQLFVAGLMVVLARYCDIVLLGKYLTLTAFWTWGAMFVDFGLNPVLIRESAEHGYNNDVLIDAVMIKAIALFIFFCLFFLWGCLFQRVSAAAIVFLPAVVGIRGGNSTLSALLAGKNMAIPAAKCQLITRIFLIVFVCYALIFKHNIGYVVCFHIVLELLLSCMLWHKTAFFIPDDSCKMSITGIKRVFRESAMIGLTGSSLFLVLKQPLFWLEKYAPSEAALYGLTVKLMEMFLVPVYALLIILFPEMVRNRNKFKLKPSFAQGALVVLLFILLIISSFVMPEFHPFRFIALRLSPLDRSMPLWVFCTILLTAVQIFCVYLFFQKKLYLVLLASVIINGAVFLYFFLFISAGWTGVFRYGNSLVVLIFSFAFILVGVWWGKMKY